MTDEEAQKMSEMIKEVPEHIIVNIGIALNIMPTVVESITPRKTMSTSVKLEDGDWKYTPEIQSSLSSHFRSLSTSKGLYIETKVKVI